MTPNEAVDYMENEIRCIQRAKFCDRNCTEYLLIKEDKPLIEAFGEAIKALEKQIPYKPKEYEDKYYACNCGNILLMKYKHYPTKFTSKSEGLPYCLACGQKLDWSDTE